jgi:hypothetical protein
MVSFAESYNNNNYYGGKKYTEWELRYDNDLNANATFNALLDITLFVIWWALCLSSEFIKR